MRKIFSMMLVAAAAMIGYTACSSDSSDDGLKSTCCERGTYQDPALTNMECYPVGTTWEIGYSHDQFKDYSLVVRYEVTDDSYQGEGDVHLRTVKGTVVELNMDGVDVDEETKAVMGGSTEHLDFKIAELGGRVEAYIPSGQSKASSGLFRMYDYNWPKVEEMSHYSVTTDIASATRKTVRLLDGKDYECLVDAEGHVTINTIGCTSVMFADWNKTADKAPLHRRLLTFKRGGVVLYDSKVAL